MNKKLITLIAGIVFLAFAKYIFSTTEGFESYNDGFIAYCAPFIVVYLLWAVGVFDRLIEDFKESNKD